MCIESYQYNNHYILTTPFFKPQVSIWQNSNEKESIIKDKINLNLNASESILYRWSPYHSTLHGKEAWTFERNLGWSWYVCTSYNIAPLQIKQL